MKSTKEAFIMRYAPALLLFTLLAIPASADTINHIAANGSFAGNAVSFDTSFNWNVTTQSLVTDSMTFHSFGFLGPFTFTRAISNIAGWVDAAHNYIQIDFARLGAYTGESFNREGVYDSFWMELYCGTYRCLDGLATGNDSGNNFWYATTGSIVITDPPDTTSVPEPATWLLLVTGLLAVAVYIIVCMNRKAANIVAMVFGEW